jgi:iron complex transport system ATP-binding protein
VTVLETSNLCVVRGGRQVLRDVMLTINPGEFVGLLGPNGAGKTTLLRAVLGLQAYRGVVRINGYANLSALEKSKLISYLPQEREIAWPLTVRKLVELGRLPYSGFFSGMCPDDYLVIEDAMRQMDVLSFSETPATQLSGGEKARVLLARALAQKAKLLLADEPTAGLDPAHQISLMKTFASHASDGESVLASLHDLGLAARWCTRLVLLVNGQIVADGEPAEVLTEANIRTHYQVESYVSEYAGGPIVQPCDLVSDEAR